MPDQGDDALPGVLAHARDLGAGNQRQRLALDVLVLALVGVGEVHPGAADPDQHLPVCGLRHGDLDQLQDLRATERNLLNGTHRPPPYSRISLTSPAE